MRFFFESAILNFFLLYLNENKQPFHMRYHLFLFLQNLGKDFIRTYMHTTVIKIVRVHNLKLYSLDTICQPFAVHMQLK
jgi:hypothetical protein